MKIALTGSHGTGKSTLAKSLARELEVKGQSVVVTPEVPRLICEQVHDNEYFRRGNNSLLRQSLILIGQLVTEKQLEGDGEIQICDRTLFDHWAYSLHLFGDDISSGDYADIYESFISRHCNTYDHIFYLPIEFEPQDDGIRESDLDFQHRIDVLLTGLYGKYSIPTVQITGSVDERTQAIIRVLED